MQPSPSSRLPPSACYTGHAWRAALVFVALTTACSSGTGGGSTGDQPSKPRADEFGTCSRLDQIGGPAIGLNPADKMSESCAPIPNRKVCVSGVTVVAIDRFDETHKGALGNYYVEDTLKPGDFSGFTVFAPSFSPPDLRLAEGDVVDILGTQSEFLGPASAGLFGQCRTLPELTGTLSPRFDGNNPLQPEVIDVTELKTYEAARKHLGKLVQIKSENGVMLFNIDDNSSGRYTGDIFVGGGIPQGDVPKVSNDLFDLKHWGALGDAGAGADAGAGSGGFSEGMTFTSITGVLTYFYGFKVSPRSAADLQL